MAYYIAILHQDPGTDFGLCFPDFPGCVAAKNNLEGLKAAAEKALAGHLQLLAEAERRHLFSDMSVAAFRLQASGKLWRRVRGL